MLSDFNSHNCSHKDILNLIGKSVGREDIQSHHKETNLLTSNLHHVLLSCYQIRE